jgi:hypothetical protein
LILSATENKREDLTYFPVFMRQTSHLIIHCLIAASFLLGVNELSQSIMWLAKPERLLALAD